MCESDDFLFRYDLQIGSIDWLVKLTDGRESYQVRDDLYRMRTWPAIDTGTYTDEMDSLLEDLHLVSCAFRYFLG